MRIRLRNETINQTINQSSLYEFINTTVVGAILDNFLLTSSGGTSKFYHTDGDQIIIDEECFISIDGYAKEDAGDTVSSFTIFKNGVRVSGAIDRHAESASGVSYSQKVQPGDVFTFTSHSGNDEARISVTAWFDSIKV